MAARRPGRPSKLTPEIIDAIRLRLLSGVSLEVAARSAGIARSTLQAWLAAGRSAEEKRAEGKALTAAERDALTLLDAVEQARADLEIEMATLLRRAARGDWRAALTVLERLSPETWGPKAKQREPSTGGRPKGAVSAPDRKRDERPGVLRRVV